ncbi:hypothetical protein OH76DRAFT_1023498 [Lentinus brumalis]|uniref:Uncharacterized protein n=1 Tax=Lentinus brumalis TaxID=2498619 RepID=A0A371CXK6_9APHY|nr:hypothetical protein OH76DRAFT_1023498 [Polyporus brumalis]
MSVRRTVRGARIRADRHRRLRSPQASRCAWCLSQRTSQRPADLSRGQSAGLSAEQRDSAITVVVYLLHHIYTTWHPSRHRHRSMTSVNPKLGNSSERFPRTQSTM